MTPVEAEPADRLACPHAATHHCQLPDIPPVLTSVRSLASLARSSSSLSSSGSLSRIGSLRLTSHAAPEVTVLLIDIKGFTARCAALPAAAVGEWVAAFYAAVDAAAAAHGVRKVETRGDCCVCVAGAGAAVPAGPGPAREDPLADQATRILAFAAALHADLAALPAGGPAAASTATRMGAATGAAAFLVGDSGGGAAPFLSVQGDAVAAAARMEALGGPGAVCVHRSTADKWAKEGGRAPPAMEALECGPGAARELVAVFDCAGRRFRGAHGAGSGRRPPRGLGAAGRRDSAPF